MVTRADVQIGITADASGVKAGVDDAKGALGGLDAAGKKAGKALDGAFAGGEKAARSLVGQVRRTQTQMRNAAAEAVTAGMKLEDALKIKAEIYGVDFERLKPAMLDATREAERLERVMQRFGLTAEQAAQVTTQGMQRVSRSMGSAKVNTAQFAAQFQDVGVTAAMGMNPLQIALQQGTQLVGQIQMMGLGTGQALKGVGSALLSLVSPLSIAVIGLTALAAWGLQSVDWASAAAGALDGIATALDVIAPYADAAAAGLATLAAGLALIYAPAVLLGIGAVTAAVVTLTRAVVRLAVAFIAAVGWPAVIVAGLVALIALAVNFREDLTKFFGFDIVGVIKDAVNKMVGMFVGAFSFIKSLWNDMLNDELTFGDMLGRAQAEFTKDLETDYIGKTSDAIQSGLAAASKGLRGMADGLVAVEDGFDGVSKSLQRTFKVIDRAEKATKRAIKQEHALSKLYGGGLSELFDADVRAIERSTQAEVNALKDKRLAIERELSKLPKASSARDEKKRAEQVRDLKAQIAEIDANLASASQKGLNAVLIAEAKYLNASQAASTATKEFVSGLERQAQAYALNIQRQDMLSQLYGAERSYAEEMLRLTDARAEALRNLAQERKRMESAGKYGEDEERIYQEKYEAIGNYYSQLNAEAEESARTRIARERDVWTAAKDAVGEYVRSAGNAATQVKETLGKAFKGLEDAFVKFTETGKLSFRDLINSMIRDLIRYMIQAQVARLATAFMGMFSKGAAFDNGKVTPFARGGVIDAGKVTPFARGGVVNRPTVFPMAGGAGLMGEAGPEAILPLRRGAGGRLGVEATAANVQVNVINQSSQQVEATASQPRWDGSLEKSVVDVVLRDIRRGGRIRPALGLA